MRSALAPLMATFVALGCSCGGDGGLRVSGDTGYVRCLAADPPSARTWALGSLRLVLEERRLVVEGAPRAARIAVFTGPVSDGAVRALRRSRPTIAVVIGSIAATPREASASLRSLAALEVPVLVIAGGADRHDALEGAFDALEGDARDRVLDATPLRAIRIGAIELVPAAGAPDGRYAISSEACGLSADDVGAIADAVGAPERGVKRYLVSWAGPRGGGAVTRGLAGVEAGSPLVADLADRIEAEGVVFAWPVEPTVAVTHDPLRVLAPPLSGAWIELADGTRRAPGATVLTVSGDGLLVADDSP